MLAIIGIALIVAAFVVESQEKGDSKKVTHDQKDNSEALDEFIH